MFSCTAIVFFTCPPPPSPRPRGFSLPSSVHLTRSVLLLFSHLLLSKCTLRQQHRLRRPSFELIAVSQLFFLHFFFSFFFYRTLADKRNSNHNPPDITKRPQPRVPIVVVPSTKHREKNLTYPMNDNLPAPLLSQYCTILSFFLFLFYFNFFLSFVSLNSSQFQ